MRYNSCVDLLIEHLDGDDDLEAVTAFLVHLHESLVELQDVVEAILAGYRLYDDPVEVGHKPFVWELLLVDFQESPVLLEKLVRRLL